MKRSIIFLLLITAIFYIACDKTAEDISSQPLVAEKFAGNLSVVHNSNTIRYLVNDEAISTAFTLDYRPLKAEPANEVEVLGAAQLSGTAGSAARNVVGGGLRKLSDYRTSYFDPAREAARIQEIRAAQEAAASGGLSNGNNDPSTFEPLTVIDWGPRGNFSSAIQRPSIYVIFSQPMVPLASLGEQSAVSPVVSISPPIKGNFRWYGTSFLSFEGEEPCLAQQVYTITVADNVQSLQGNRISGETVFNFYTETLKISNFTVGEEFSRNNNIRFSNNNVPPLAARQISLTFNYPIRVNDINQYLEVTSLTLPNETINQIRFNLKQDNEYKITAELLEPVNFETEVKITLKRGARSSGGNLGTEADQFYTFKTPDSFYMARRNQYLSHGRYGYLFEFHFSHLLNENTFRNAISAVRNGTNERILIEQDNIEVRGSTLRIFNLPVNFRDRFHLTIASNVEDIYGRKLEIPYICEIVMPDEPPPEGSAAFLDYRNYVMLESQFPPRFLFEYQNISTGSHYMLKANDNPWNKDWSNSTLVHLVPETPNTKYFEDINLSPYLNSRGKGFVNFRADLQLLTRERQDDNTFRTGRWRLENNINIQVTDLGLTVRYGFNKAVVLVTSLSSGNPIEGVSVKMLSSSDVASGSDLYAITDYIEAITDSNGLALLDMNSELLRTYTRSERNWQGFEAPFIMAEKDGDRAVFNPSSHNIWRFNVFSEIPQRAEEIVPIAFMFSDRGLYKPGETLTFRGVDRSKILGMYTIYQGDYTVIFEEAVYRPVQVAVLTGTTSESGGFYGSIEIPDDLKPGSYRLIYKRNDDLGDEIIANVPVTVAFFERLRFQASLSSPVVPVIMGDDISLNLNASYLSGGSLSGAEWESSWYEGISYFRPPQAENRGFVFGPSRAWDSSRYISSESGVLSGQGTAGISIKTGGSKVVGAPYAYQAEARVTDISNQMIAASRSVMVHPASFYIGLHRSAAGGFARVGQELSYDYITVNTQGERVLNNALFLQSGQEAGQVKVELIREEWRRIQQRGVGGYVYDEYSPQQIVDSEQTIPIRNSGSIKVSPSVAGFYTLRLSAKDREGRTALTELNFYVTGSGGYWNTSNPSEIRLTPDQEIYEPGDTAKILMQSTLPSGWYLITVEREGIFTEEVRHFAEPVTVIDIPIARNYVPVVYVSVSSYSVRSGPPSHEYGSPDLDKPNGYFGVTKVMVNPRTRAFSVTVESDKRTYRPGEEVTMTLTATRDGRPLPNAELTLMAVDRGVLDLIGYHVPDPINYFYSEYRFPLSVGGGDSRSILMDPVTYSVKNLAGGDSDGSKIEERKDFNPTAVFEPFLVTDANGKVMCKFTLPDNLTTYRVTVFGVRGDLFALKESELAAQNRINVREVLPRRLRERDTAEAGVLITNLDSTSHTITVKLDIGDPLTSVTSNGISKKTGLAFVDGTAERRVTVRSGENAVVYFDVGAEREGVVTLNFTINSTVLNERLIREMVIERPYIMETVTTTGSVTGNSHTEAVVIPSFADNGAGNLTVSLDATRLSLLDSAITYLFNYPYGCLEQRSSAIMPLVVFGEYLDALSLKSEVSNPAAVVDGELRSWAQLQLSNGGFPYWPSGTRADFYVSLRIAHTIAIAKSNGIDIPHTLNTMALNSYLNREYQEMQRLRPTSSSYNYQSYLQSYMLYVQALSGESVDPSRLAEILNRDNADPSVLAFTGMTYRIMGRSFDAANTAQRLRTLIRMTARGAEITDPLAGSRFNFYGGEIEQMALTLHFFVDQFPSDEINSRLLYSLLEKQRSQTGHWQSTAVTFRVLSAIDALIKAENLENLDVSGSVSLGGTRLLNGVFKGLAAKPVADTIDFKGSVMVNLPRDQITPLVFARNGTGAVYFTASLRYAIPSELQSFRDEGLGVFMTIYDIATGEEIKSSALQSGRTYRARVRVSSTRERTFVALRIPVPSGTEILDAAFVTTASYSNEQLELSDNAGRSWVSHQTIYDNEIQYFWDRFYRGESTVSFLFRTARRGVYPTPPVQAECMYEPEIFGRTQGLLYTIE